MQLSFFINFLLLHLYFIASYLLCNSGLSNVWPAMLSDVAYTEVKADKELCCIYLDCKGEI